MIQLPANRVPVALLIASVAPEAKDDRLGSATRVIATRGGICSVPATLMRWA